MIQHLKISPLFYNENGFTLLELVIVIVLIGFFLGVIVVNGMGYINRSRLKSTLQEMSSIAQASIDYYHSSGNPNDPINPTPLTWPSPTELCFIYISGCAKDPSTGNILFFKNPFGYDYSVSPGGNNMVEVSTKIPANAPINEINGTMLTKQQQEDGSWMINFFESIPNGAIYADNN